MIALSKYHGSYVLALSEHIFPLQGKKWEEEVDMGVEL
jgi:hypothetical protein